MILTDGIEKDSKGNKERIDGEKEGTSDLLKRESNESNQAEDHVKYEEDHPRVLETVRLLIRLLG